jgi:copper resistance protein B
VKRLLIQTLIVTLTFSVFCQSVFAESDRTDWPSPVIDDGTYTFALVDLLEYRTATSDLNWDFLAWHGGDVNRIWIRSEGQSRFGSDRSRDADLEFFYGRLVLPFFDALIGARFEHREAESSNSRAQLAIGLEGVAPYYFEVEPTFYLGQKGEVSFSLEATRDYLMTQRLVLQGRLDVKASASENQDFGTKAGVNEFGLSARLRYEIRREFAPYLGLSWLKTSNQTAAANIQNERSDLSAVAGLRLWY